jgi:hypothetical protein
VVTAIPSRFISRKEIQYPLYRRLGESQGRPGRVGKISLPPGFDPRPVPAAASRYPAPRVLDGCWFIYCHLCMSNYSLFSNVSASQTIYGRCFLQMQYLKQMRWSLPLLTSAQVMVMFYRNKKRHYVSVVHILSLWLYYLYRRLRIGQVPCLLISCPLPSSCKWFSFLFIVLSITKFFGRFLILLSLDLCGNVLSV